MADSTPNTPGKLLKQLLSDKEWTQAELAGLLEIPPSRISEVVQNKRAIDATLAKLFAEVFMETTPEQWMELESKVQLSKVKNVDESVKKRVQLLEVAPTREMERRGWITPSKDANELERELTKFFGMNPLAADPSIGAVTRKSDAEEPLSSGQRAWCFRVRQLANLIAAPDYVESSIPTCIRQLRELAAYPQEAHKVPLVLLKHGIRLVIVEPLSGIKVDGVALWLNSSAPVIGLSLRYDRIDSFWFTLFHELSHIIHRDEAPLDIDLTDRMSGITIVRAEMERRANKEAADMLIPNDELTSFIRRVGPLYSKVKINQFSHRLRVHPGIVVGQLQRRDEIGYNANREMLVKVRDFITTTSITDGWGHNPDTGGY